MNLQSNEEYSHAPVLRSIANSIQPLFPSAADTLRGIANDLERKGGRL